jgi:hypothetical protein
MSSKNVIKPGPRDFLGITLAELLHGLLMSQYASIHPEGLFDLPLQMPDGLPVTCAHIEDGVITISDDDDEDFD